MREKEISNCKNYEGAQKVVEFWRKEDEDFNTQFDAYGGKVFYYDISSHRGYRVTVRFQWERLVFPKYL